MDEAAVQSLAAESEAWLSLRPQLRDFCDRGIPPELGIRFEAVRYAMSAVDLDLKLLCDIAREVRDLGVEQLVPEHLPPFLFVERLAEALIRALQQMPDSPERALVINFLGTRWVLPEALPLHAAGPLPAIGWARA